MVRMRTITTAMPMSLEVLTLAQWLSPAFPVGAFSYSHGLEAAFEAGRITTAEGLEAWLADLLASGSGRADARLIAAAFRGAVPLDEIDATARAFAASAERRLEAEAQGAAFVQTVNAVWRTDLADLALPVALGAAAARAGLPLDLTLALYLQAFVANLVACAQRLGPIGQTEGQRIVHALAPVIETVVADAADGDLARLASAAFLSDIASMRHETQYSRIFRS